MPSIKRDLLSWFNIIILLTLVIGVWGFTVDQFVNSASEQTLARLPESVDNLDSTGEVHEPRLQEQLSIEPIADTNEDPEVLDDIENIKVNPTSEDDSTLIFIENVPFTSQAPFAEWNDARFQDGCEEASALMAIYWTEGKTSLTKEEAKAEIVAMSDYQTEHFGEYRDTSADDMADRIIKGYFNYDQVEVKHDITIEDIINELRKDNLVISPMDGKALGNPNFTAPGPERHMLVIRGYDYNTKEFITNDPGTRNGEEYRYNQDVLFNSIRDYPTGYHVPIEGYHKVMIIISRNYKT